MGYLLKQCGQGRIWWKSNTEAWSQRIRQGHLCKELGGEQLRQRNHMHQNLEVGNFGLTDGQKKYWRNGVSIRDKVVLEFVEEGGAL